jgi:hypothetical protein
MFNKSGFELVDGSISVDESSVSVDVNFEGTYPLKINDHFVLLIRRRDTLRFICGVCDKKIELSESIWRSSTKKSRRDATKYVVGHFYESSCVPDNINDVVESVIKDYRGYIMSEENLLSIEDDLKMELSDCG